MTKRIPMKGGDEYDALTKARKFAERMKTDREIFEYHCQHDISGSVSDLIEISDTTGQDC